jgi:RNA polymerase sigma factor (TIGR02999 family)
MSEITTLLQAARGGDREAADRAYSLLYADLRRLAHSRLRREGVYTLLDTTSLVHESYLRLHGSAEPGFAGRDQFLAYAARVMRSVVVDLVRARNAERRGGGAAHVTLSTTLVDGGLGPAGHATGRDEVLQVHEALDALEAQDARLASVVEMRYFGGLSEREIAEAMGVTERTVQRDWQKARLFLAMAIG